MKTKEVLPPGFTGVLANLIAAKKAQMPLVPKRRGLLANIERDLALGKTPGKLEFSSEVNYSYNRHADALFDLWQKRDLAALKAYPLNGKNTYARALARYRDLLVGNLREAS